MTNSSLLRVFWVVVACVALSWAPKSVCAQRGGHGGGGGFQGGSGGGFHGSVGGFHGGGGHYAYGGGHYGGYYGRGYYGGRGGYYGHGAHWGYPRYGRYGYGYAYGWGFGFGWGWPYWYPYGYSGWWASPRYYAYYYPYYAPDGYSYPDNGGGGDAPPPGNPGAKSHNNSPVKPSRIPASESAPNTYAASSNLAAFAPTAPLHTTGRTIATASDYRLAHSEQQFPPLRREVQNALRAVREMPPFAFQRRIDSGLYSDFTPEERTLLDQAAQFQLAWEKP